MYKPTSVDDYFSTLSGKPKEILSKLRKKIKEIVPESEEVITYGMSGASYKGKGLVAYSAFKNHWSYFPMSGAVLENFKEELKDHYAGKGTLQFSYDEEISDELLKRLLQTRINEIESKLKK